MKNRGENKRGGEIIKIKDLFGVYKKRLTPPQGVVISAFRDVVRDVLDISPPKDHIRYHVATRMLSIHAPGQIKTEILLHKEEILAHLKGRLGEERSPRDII